MGTGRWTESGRRAAPTTRGIRSARQAGRCGAEAPPDRTLVLCITTVFGGSGGAEVPVTGGGTLSVLLWLEAPRVIVSRYV